MNDQDIDELHERIQTRVERELDDEYNLEARRRLRILFVAAAALGLILLVQRRRRRHKT